MFTETYFHSNSTAFHSDDRWLRVLFQLHVPSNYANDRQFKTDAIETMRTNNVYKKAKVKQDEVEANLMDCNRLSPASFCALATCFNVNIMMVMKRVCVNIGSPVFMVVARTNQIVLSRIVENTDLLPLLSCTKPFYALSHYTLAELEQMAAAVRTQKGSKQHIYNGLSAYAEQRLTDF